MAKFKHIEVVHIPRSRRASADALVKLAAALFLPEGEAAQVTVKERWLLLTLMELIPEEYEFNTITTNVIEEGDWLTPFLDYFKHDTLPDDLVKRYQLQTPLLRLQGWRPLQRSYG